MAEKPVGYDELIIGTALNGGPIHDFVDSGKLPAKVFEAAVPRLIWKTIQAFYQKRQDLPDIAVLTDLFAKHKKKNQVLAYARRATRATKDTELNESKVNHYIEQLKSQHEDAAYRRALEKAIEIRKSVGLRESKDFLSSVLDEETVSDENIETIDLLGDFNEIKADIIHKREHPEASDIVPLGIGPFDHVMNGGVKPGELLLIAGIPSGGKSIGLQDFSVSIAEQGYKSHLFTIEMSASQTGFRNYTRMSGVPTSKFRNPESITDEDVARWERGVNKLKGVKGAGLKVTGIPEHANTRFMRAELAKLKRKAKWKPDVVLVDYAGIMRPSDSNRYANDSDWAFIGQNVLDLKNWAKAEKIPVISAVQLHPSAEGEEILTYNHLGLSKILIAAHADVILAIIPMDREEAEYVEVMRWQWLKAREGAVDEFGQRITFTDLRPDFSNIRIHSEAKA